MWCLGVGNEMGLFVDPPHKGEIHCVLCPFTAKITPKFHFPKISFAQPWKNQACAAFHFLAPSVLHFISLQIWMQPQCLKLLHTTLTGHYPSLLCLVTCLLKHWLMETLIIMTFRKITQVCTMLSIMLIY